MYLWNEKVPWMLNVHLVSPIICYRQYLTFWKCLLLTADVHKLIAEDCKAKEFKTWAFTWKDKNMKVITKKTSILIVRHSKNVIMHKTWANIIS